MSAASLPSSSNESHTLLETITSTRYDRPMTLTQARCFSCLHPRFSRTHLLHAPHYQLTLICEKLGKLQDHELDFITSEKARRFMRKLSNKPPAPLNRQFPNTPSDALDFMRKMLQIHPRKRISVEQALAHPFLSQLHSPADEPVAPVPFDFSFEDERLHRVRLQQLIWQEVGDFRPSCLPVPPPRS